jgi:hypothetical protein
MLIPQQPLKKYTREEFNRTAIGREMNRHGLLELLDGGTYAFDDLKPRIIHEVTSPAPDMLPGSYYSLYGWRRDRGTIFAALTLANGTYADEIGSVVSLGTEQDRIDAQFVIDPAYPGTVFLRYINRFRCKEATPRTEEEADSALREIEGYLKLLGHGHLVNFQRAKDEVWNAAGQASPVRGRRGAADVLTEAWQRAGITRSPMDKYPIRLLQGEGLYNNRLYRDLPPKSGPKP